MPSRPNREQQISNLAQLANDNKKLLMG